ncbi:hypothetical protein AB2L27_12325 [Kineococcus sp. LSe6-4]|uniref:SAF domain-containing protein n=1 Tax=Kineococcus halophytocola TaxID=3234027 RepID=A0ABV4H1U5_9ACTN
MRTAVGPVRGRDVAQATGRPGAATRRVGAPSWRDPRLLVGLLLVTGSVVLGSVVVGRAQGTTAVWGLAHAVGAGQTLTASDLTVVQVRLDPATAGRYVPADVPAGSVAGEGVVALRGLGAGELLPRASVGAADDLTARPVTVPVEGAVPPGVAVGSLVDLWVVPAGTDGVVTVDGADTAPAAPERLVAAAEVSAVVTGGGALATRAGADVQVVVPQDVLPAVLRAGGSGDDLVLVPVPGGAGGGS